MCIRDSRGEVHEWPHSAVAASLLEDGLYARILLPDGQEYWLEPVNPVVPAAPLDQYVFYHAEDVIPNGKSCGAEALHHPEIFLPPPRDGEPREPCGTGNMCVAELACDADYPFFQRYGSVAAVEARINSVINTVNIQYERDVSITHQIVAIVVRSSSASDPYTTSDAGSLLNQFRNHWIANHSGIQRDMAQLFTGRNLDGSTIGIAWLSAVCTSYGYAVVESDCCGSLSCAADLSAHEMGHNWGASHCNCPSYTMNPSLTCSNQFEPSTSIPEIVSYRNSIQGCLTALIDNDLCANAILVTNGTYTDSTMGANNDGSASCGSSSSSPDVWYKYIAPGSGTLNVNTCTGSAFDTVLSIHSGCPGTTANQLSCNDNGCSTNKSTITMNVTAGTTYLIRVSGKNYANGDFTLSVTGPGDTQPPTPNPMEFSTPPYADSTTSIRMIAALATDAASPPVQYKINFVYGGSGGDDSAWQDARMYLDTGLEVNTQYTYRVKARDTAPNLNETAYSAQYTVATFAAVPPPPVLSGAAYNSLVVDPQPGANPPHTHLAIQCTASNPNDPNWTGKFVAANGSPTAAAVWQTDAAWAAKTVTGLQPSTSYSFAVKARNLDGLETALGSAASLSTTSGPTGACCFEDGFCWVATLTDCGFSGGSYQGDAVPCDPNPCPQPIGACCFPNGTCSIELEDDCWLAGGDFQGIGTTCSPNPCPQPTGACCAADGSCSVLTQAQCTASGGTYQGNGTGCSPNPCPQPTGACCAANGSCSVVTQAQCTASGGTYQGNGTGCSPNPCPQPTGACCAADGTCSILTQAQCIASGGTYQGNGTGCSPNPCPQPCPLLGDLNGDGVVNGLDIQGFVNALIADYNPCADVAAPQGVLDMDDAASFVNLLLAGS